MRRQARAAAVLSSEGRGALGFANNTYDTAGVNTSLESRLLLAGSAQAPRPLGKTREARIQIAESPVDFGPLFLLFKGAAHGQGCGTSIMMAGTSSSAGDGCLPNQNGGRACASACALQLQPCAQATDSPRATLPTTAGTTALQPCLLGPAAT